jgi:DNA repair exonuclease SbcCD ATPase subunit
MKLEDLIRLNEEFAQVELEFEWENNKYKIIRRINREKKGVSSEAEVYKNNALLESGQSACTEYIERILEIDYELYTRAIYSEQNNIDHFLNLDPRKRKTEIDTLLGLDKFESARGNLVSLITKINEERKQTEEKTDRKKFEESINLEGKTREEYAKNERRKVEISKNLQIKREEEAKEEIRLREIIKKIENIEKMEKEIAELEYFIKANQNEELEKFDIKKIDELQAKKTQINQIKTSIESKLRETEKIFVKINSDLHLEKNRKKTIQENETKLAKMEQEIKELERDGEFGKISENNEKLRKEILEIGVKIKRNEERIRENKELLEKLKEGMEKCPLCESKIDQKCMEKIREDKNREEVQKTEENKTNVIQRKRLEEILK